MAQIHLDTTGNTHHDLTLAAIEANFTDLYALDPTFPVPIASGGTGAATAADARTALSAAKSGANTDITSLASLTTATASGLTTVGSMKVDTGTKTATASGGAATLNKSSGIITTEPLTTAADGSYTLTLTNSTIAAGDMALVSLDTNGSAGTPELISAKCTANTLTVIIYNDHVSAAFNAALKIAFLILKA